MKFSDGNWLIREGIRMDHPRQAYEVELDGNSLIVYAPCKAIENRGQTLDGPLLTIRFSSPMPDVIRVQVVHFKGQKNPSSPQFDLHHEDHPVHICNDDDAVSLTSGQLSVRIQKGDRWSIDYLHGETRLTGSDARGMGLVCKDGRETYLVERLGLSVGECVYGLGERFTPFVKNGQSVEIWNEDGGTSTEQSYKSIPFYMTNRGYGVFINHPERVSLEVASEKVSKVQFSVAGESLDYLVINGPTPKEVLSRYTALTGRPALPPAWSFGLWLTTSFTTEYNEDTVIHFVDGMAQRDLPLHVFHFDCFWMKEYEWTNLTWNTHAFPHPTALLQKLKDRGLKISLWINPYIAQKSELFAAGVERGFLLTRPNGDVWQWDLWQAGMGIVDFSNPHAVQWFSDKLRDLIHMGVDCFKTDFGERIPTDVVYFDGSDPLKMHNYYTFLYNQAVFTVLREMRGDRQAVLFARSATVGSQRFPVHWGGDSEASYESMAESLRGGLSLSMCGFGFWSHDIGGFENTATPDLYKRWTAFGLLSTHSRLHGNSSYRVPWLFDDEAVDVLRHFTGLKCRLMPYLFACATETAQTGIPVLRPMIIEYPTDRSCDYLDRQYMLGSSLLVAPIFSEDGKASYYLPTGVWTHLLTGERKRGGRWFGEAYDYFSLPLFVRSNTIIAMGEESRAVEYDYCKHVTLHLFELEDGCTASASVYALDGDCGLRVQATREGLRVRIECTRSVQPWSILFRGLKSLACIRGGTWTIEQNGVRILAEGGTKHIEIELQASV